MPQNLHNGVKYKNQLDIKDNVPKKRKNSESKENYILYTSLRIWNKKKVMDKTNEKEKRECEVSLKKNIKREILWNVVLLKVIC